MTTKTFDTVVKAAKADLTGVAMVMIKNKYERRPMLDPEANLVFIPLDNIHAGSTHDEMMQHTQILAQIHNSNKFSDIHGRLFIRPNLLEPR